MHRKDSLQDPKAAAWLLGIAYLRHSRLQQLVWNADASLVCWLQMWGRAMHRKDCLQDPKAAVLLCSLAAQHHKSSAVQLRCALLVTSCWYMLFYMPFRLNLHMHNAALLVMSCWCLESLYFLLIASLRACSPHRLSLVCWCLRSGQSPWALFLWQK